MRLTKLPVCAVQNEGQFGFDSKTGENQWHDVGLADREAVEGPFDTSDDRFKLGCSGEAILPVRCMVRIKNLSASLACLTV